MSFRSISLLLGLCCVGFIAYDYFTNIPQPVVSRPAPKGNLEVARMHERQIEMIMDQIRRSQGHGTDPYRDAQRMKEIATLREKAALARQGK